MKAEAKTRFREYQGNVFFRSLILSFISATKVLPRWFMRLTAHFFCTLFILFTFANYRAIIANMKIIFSDRGLFFHGYLAYRVFLKYSYYLIDLFFISHGRERIKKFRIRYVGDEFLFDALHSGKGIIILTLHMGNWEIGGLALAERGLRPPTIAYYPDSQGIIEERRNRLRKLSNTTHVELRPGEFSAIRFFRILQEGGIIAIQGDRIQHDRGMKMDMFGQEALFPRGPVVLALASEAIILPAFMVMEGYNTYAIHVEKPLAVPVYSNTEETVRESLSEIIAIFEKYIKRYPDQWYTFMPFWLKDKERFSL